MNPLTQEWLEVAEDDLKTAQLLLAHRGPPRAICFHCQQAVEKFLKAFLQEQGVAPPHVHFLPQLLAEGEEYESSLNTLQQAIQQLNVYYIPLRYPPISVTPTEQEAEEAVTLAEQVKETIGNALGFTSSE